MQQKMIQFSGDVSLPAIGQGTWYMGEDDRHPAHPLRRRV